MTDVFCVILIAIILFNLKRILNLAAMKLGAWAGYKAGKRVGEFAEKRSQNRKN